MPPKRKAPLATADANALGAPAAKKTAKGKKAAEASAPADKKYKYSDPSTVANQGPVDVAFFMWAKDEEDEDDEDGDGDEDEDNPEPGSLQYILNGIENEKFKAFSDAFNAQGREKGYVSMLDMGPVQEEISKAFEKRAEEARKKVVDAQIMTEEEAKATVGVDDLSRRGKRRIKQNFQEKLNEIQLDLEKACHEAQKFDHKRCMSSHGGRARIDKAEAPFLKKMEEAREAVVKYTQLTMEEATAIQPNIEIEVDNNGNVIRKEKNATKAKKDAEKEAFVPPRVVTDKGFPVSKAGMQKCFEIMQEVEKRDPDFHGMYICNDFAGYGVTEVMENLLAEFNKIIFKKDISPLQKWTIVEGLTTYLHMGNHMSWMMNEDSEAVNEVLNMMGVMFVTALEMLHESGLLGPTSPLPDNVGIMTLLFLEFMTQTCSDFDLEWIHEIVRAADSYGVVLTPPEKIGFGQDALDEWRETCRKRKMVKGFAWKTEYPKFKRNHRGGHEYDISKMSKKEKAQYEFGTEEHDAKMREFLGEDSGGDDSDSD